MITIDTETVGLHGMPVLLQWAKDDGPINVWDIWINPFRETLELIEQLLDDDIQGFNLSFDWFMLCKLYSTWSLYPDLGDYPVNHVNEIAHLEEKARFLDLCIKPKRARDVMLLARKGPYQTLMARDDICIRRVPTPLAGPLRDELESRVKLEDIYFSKGGSRWKVYNCKKGGRDNPHFKDIKLKFSASASLKALAKHVLGVKETRLFSQIEPPGRPDEYGYAPYALAVAPEGEHTHWTNVVKGKKLRAWPLFIEDHIYHWKYNEDARLYASNDVDYTRRLGKIISPEIPPGDDDSELACMVAACRWKGYAIDRQAVLEQKALAVSKLGSAPRDPEKVRLFVGEKFNDLERLGFTSTKKVVLQDIAKMTIIKDNGDEIPHPASERAQAVLDSRKSKKKIELLDKVLLANRLHASFIVLGALSARMSGGGGGINTQGIDHTYLMRACFPLADGGCWRFLNGEMVLGEGERMYLCGGDFKSFEVSLACKVFDDQGLTNDILSGKKIHAMLAVKLFPGKTYEDILATEGQDPDLYDTGKKGVFLMFYGGDENTYKNKLGVPIEIGKAAIESFMRERKGILIFRQWVNEHFQALRQPGGIGTKVNWVQPDEYAESFLGFKRYFTLEIKIAKFLYDLAQNPPKAWRAIRITVRRREKIQTASGAVQSALYGSAFGIVSGMVRAALNHYIQSPGAIITKAVQRAIWDFQPPGVHKWLVQPMNVHDEIMTPTRESLIDAVEKRVKDVVNEYKKIVPLLAIDWFKRIPNWAAKKG